MCIAESDCTGACRPRGGNAAAAGAFCFHDQVKTGKRNSEWKTDYGGKENAE